MRKNKMFTVFNIIGFCLAVACAVHTLSGLHKGSDKVIKTDKALFYDHAQDPALSCIKMVTSLAAFNWKSGKKNKRKVMNGASISFPSFIK